VKGVRVNESDDGKALFVKVENWRKTKEDILKKIKKEGGEVLHVGRGIIIVKNTERIKEVLR